jgi:hypothetical protein
MVESYQNNWDQCLPNPIILTVGKYQIYTDTHTGQPLPARVGLPFFLVDPMMTRKLKGVHPMTPCGAFRDLNTAFAFLTAYGGHPNSTHFKAIHDWILAQRTKEQVESPLLMPPPVERLTCYGGDLTYTDYINQYEPAEYGTLISVMDDLRLRQERREAAAAAAEERKADGPKLTVPRVMESMLKERKEGMGIFTVGHCPGAKTSVVFKIDGLTDAAKAEEKVCEGLNRMLSTDFRTFDGAEGSSPMTTFGPSTLSRSADRALDKYRLEPKYSKAKKQKVEPKVVKVSDVKTRIRKSAGTAKKNSKKHLKSADSSLTTTTPQNAT